jgi:hypothetical protein
MYQVVSGINNYTKKDYQMIMKLKTLIVAIALSLPVCQAVKAQTGAFEVHLNLGYGFNTATSTFISDDGNTLTVVPYSLGSGLNIDLGGTYMIGDHLGLGLDLTDVMSGPIKYTSYRSQGDIQVNNTYTGGLYAITPMLVLSANHPDAINPYGKFGLVLGSATITYTATESGKNSNSGTYIDVYSGNLAIGAYAAFGLAVPLSVKLNLEVFDRTLSYSPSKLSNTQAYDGGQKLNDLTYVTSKNGSSASDTQLASYWPFSSIGLKVGISLFLK